MPSVLKKIKLNIDNLQAISNLLSQVVLNGVNFGLIIVFTHFLTTADYGVVSIYMSYTFFVAVFVGLATQGSIGTALVHWDKREHDKYLSNILAISFISFVACSVISIIFISPISEFTRLEPFLLIVLLVHSFGIFCFGFAQIKYIYSRTAQYSLGLALALSVSMIVLSWIGIKHNWFPEKQYVVRIMSMAIPYMFCVVYVLVTFFSKQKPFVDFRKSCEFCLPICIPLIFHGLSHIVLSQTGRVMLQQMLNDISVVGIYSFIITFSYVLNTIYVAFNNTWVPIFYNYLKADDIKGIIVRTKKYNNFYTLLVVGFLMVAPEFIYSLADENYWCGIKLVPIAATSIYLVFLYSFAVNYELYHKESKLVAIGTIGAALSNIIFNYLLIPDYGMYGAAIATFIAYVFLVVFHTVCAKKFIVGIYPYSDLFFIPNLIIVLIASAGFYLFLDYWYLRWGVAVVDGVVLVRNLYKERKLF